MAKDQWVTMAFRVRAEEAKMIERYAKKEGTTVSKYVRTAVFFDMVMGGDWEAFRHVASEVRAIVLERMRKRFGFQGGEVAGGV